MDDFQGGNKIEVNKNQFALIEGKNKVSLKFFNFKICLSLFSGRIEGWSGSMGSIIREGYWRLIVTLIVQ